MTDLTLPITHVAPLVPHGGEMILIDRIMDFGDDFLLAQADINEDHVLVKNAKLNALAGLEIMAQGVAAWSGCQAALSNQPVRLGYLLGCRKLFVHQQEIPFNCTVQAEIKLSLQDSTGFGVFDCRLINLENQQIIIEGALNVFSPNEEQKNDK